jgi:hypothetical protein
MAAHCGALGTGRESTDGRRTCLTGPMDPIRRPIHPRIQRRRDLAASLHIPPELGASFTESETPSEAAELAKLIDAFTRVNEAVDFEGRLKRLEGKVVTVIPP